MTRYRLREWEPGLVELDLDQVAPLRSALPSVSISPVSATQLLVTPGSHVGVVRIGDDTVEVQPKIGIGRVMFLISYALDRVRARLPMVDVGLEPTVHEAMAALFVAMCDTALRPGVLQGYQVREEALGVLRGRIRFDDQLRNHFGRTPPIEVRYDEFTEDIELNRMLKAAVRRLRPLPLRSPELRRRLHHIEHLLENVSWVEYDRTNVPEPTIDRLSERYRPAIALARLILNATSAEVRTGTTPAFSFTVDMNQVFEDFVTVALREALGVSARAFPQNARGHRLALDTASNVRLEPDLSWWVDGRCVFVGDVKYKRVRPDGVLHADVYQLLAYLVATELPAGLLVYAKGEAEAVVHEVVHLGKRIEVAALRLDGTPDDLLREIGELADRIRDLRRFADVDERAA